MPKLERASAVSDYVDLYDNAQGSLSVSGTAADTDALEAGIYDVWCDVDVYLKIAPIAADDVTTSTGYLLRSDNTVTFLVRDQHKIGAIGTSGTLRYHKVD